MLTVAHASQPARHSRGGSFSRPEATGQGDHNRYCAKVLRKRQVDDVIGNTLMKFIELNDFPRQPR